MPLRQLDPVNIRSLQRTRLAEICQDGVGLPAGSRPPFSVKGAWLACGKRASVHLVDLSGPLKAAEPRLEPFAFPSEEPLEVPGDGEKGR